MRVKARRLPLALILTGIVYCAAQVSGHAQSDRNTRLFADLAGEWSGAGSVSLAGGGAERLRCRAAYNPADTAHLSLSLRCASASFKMEVESDITREGNRIAGAWRESTFGASGNVAGTVRGNRIDAVINGMGVSARLAMSMRGNLQSVTLVSQGQISGTASVMLRRE